MSELRKRLNGLQLDLFRVKALVKGHCWTRAETLYSKQLKCAVIDALVALEDVKQEFNRIDNVRARL